MAIRESIRDLKNIQYNEQKKTEQKKQFENTVYKLLNKEFNQSTNVSLTYENLLVEKNNIVYEITPKNITLYESSKIYNKILNELYKERSINNQKEELQNSKTELYNELESYFIKYNSAAYNILLDFELKNDILRKYILLFPEKQIDFKKYYDKTIKQLYNEFSNYEVFEEVEPKKELDWSFFWLTILKILLFPILIICGTAASRGKGRRKND